MNPTVRIAIPSTVLLFVFAARPASAAGCAPGFADLGGGMCGLELLYTGVPATLAVPAGIGVLTVVASGGAGGTSLEDEGAASAGGLGGRMTATVSVTPGDTLTVLVGQSGADGILQPSGFGGWPDGGHSASRYGGCGGGGSYVFDSTGLLVAAGGGGGGGHDYNPAWSATGNQENWGGAGSGANAQDGNSVRFKGSGDPAYGSPGAGKGATTSAPGIGGTPDLPPSWFGFGISTGETGWGPTETPDVLGKGGDSYPAADTAGFGNGGGGGGGYYGGGGGGTIDSMVSGGGGGGGSGFVTPAALSASPATGVQTADGAVTIRYDSNQLPPSTTTTTTTTSTVPTTSTTTIPAPCAPVPSTGCHMAAAGKSSLAIVENADPRKDAFAWNWKGDATAVAEFGDPTGGTPTLTACVYDASGRVQPLAQAMLPAGGACAGRPCWKTTGRATSPTGYKYKNPAATPDGFTTATLHAGDAGKAQIALKAKGSNVRNPALELTLPVTAQLVIEDGAGTACWQSTYGSASTNTAARFKAKGP